MQRRALLASVGTGAIVGAGGCLVAPWSSDDPDDGTSTGDSVVTSTDIADQPCPPYDVDTGSAVCSHTVDTDEASVYLETDRERGKIANGIPTELITLTLHNESPEDLAVDPHGWRIRHNDGSGWEDVPREVRREDDLTVEAGGEASWTFLLAYESVQADPELEPGLYAAELAVPDPGDTDDRVACIALVRLDANE